MTGPVEERLSRRHKKGVYLIKRAVEAVATVLRYDDGRQIRTTPIFEPPQRLGFFGRVASAGVVHRRQKPIRGGVDGGGLREERSYEANQKHDYEEKPKQKHGVVNPSRPPAGRRRLRQPGDKGGAGNHQQKQERVVQHQRQYDEYVEDALRVEEYAPEVRAAQQEQRQ